MKINSIILEFSYFNDDKPIITNLLLFQVRDLVEKCTCPSQFPMVRVSEGKYRIGDTKVLIFVRVSKNIYELNKKSSRLWSLNLVTTLVQDR